MVMIKGHYFPDGKSVMPKPTDGTLGYDHGGRAKAKMVGYPCGGRVKGKMKKGYKKNYADGGEVNY